MCHRITCRSHTFKHHKIICPWNSHGHASYFTHFHTIDSHTISSYIIPSWSFLRTRSQRQSLLLISEPGATENVPTAFSKRLWRQGRWANHWNAEHGDDHDTDYLSHMGPITKAGLYTLCLQWQNKEKQTQDTRWLDDISKPSQTHEQPQSDMLTHAEAFSSHVAWGGSAT